MLDYVEYPMDSIPLIFQDAAAGIMFRDVHAQDLRRAKTMHENAIAVQKGEYAMAEWRNSFFKKLAASLLDAAPLLLERLKVSHPIGGFNGYINMMARRRSTRSLRW